MTTDHFPAFAKMMAASFAAAVKKPDRVFVVDFEPDALYAAYLTAFPAGTNPPFKARTEHDCGCCKSFIRRAGLIVHVDDAGHKHTIWEHAARNAPEHYALVAAKLNNIVIDQPIANLFRVSEKETSFGNQVTRSQDKVTERVITWNHFHTGPIPDSLRCKLPDTVRGEFRTEVEVFERGLTSLKPDAVATVLSLLDAHNLYKWEEYQPLVAAFARAQEQFLKMPAPQQNVFVWTHGKGALAKFKNTSIGQLVEAIGDGKDVEDAVRAFEAMVAPQNYRRPTAIITPGMVKQAMKTLEELGLEPALERRFARIGDISVNDVKWVDSRTRANMKGGIGGMLMAHATASGHERDLKRAEDITIDVFMDKVLPQAKSMELLFTGGHVANLASLTAPVHDDAKLLFKWDNPFAWSYINNVTDSIKELVKRAGGNITAPLRASLAWSNGDDLDLHAYEPKIGIRSQLAEGNHIGYDTPFRKDRSHAFSPLGGQLDVDMNAGGPTNSKNPVENIYWKQAHPGRYKIQVHQFAKRSNAGVGFTVEIEVNGKITTFTYAKAVRDKARIDVCNVIVAADGTATFEVLDDGISSSAISQDRWGLKTESYVGVNVVTYSPNYWGENKVGHRHVFFVLDGCKNDEAARGVYNEFLRAELEKHGKVFELIGEKTKCQPTDGQLSGLAFSYTKPASVAMKVMTHAGKQIVYNVRMGA